jgi:opacity protein-like surface antigen
MVIEGARGLVEPKRPTRFPRSCGSHITAAAWIVLAASLLGASGAQAENCTVPSFNPFGNVATVASVATSVAANISANIAAANTAFLTQSSAFVTAPANPLPDQQGGGVWTRGVVGQVDVKSASSNSLVLQAPPGTTLVTGSEPCSTVVRASFDGIQFGSDIARLNMNGWNLHVGATAGSLYLNNSIVGGAPLAVSVTGNTTVQVPFDSSAQVPFIGAYATATNGGFFADLLIRGDAYQMSLNSPGLNFYNQNLNARGLSISGSAGYNYEIPNGGGWFIEPSAGLLYSRVKVDALNIAGSPSVFEASNSGTETFNDVVDTIGRLGLRTGTSFSYGSLSLQPFVAASVWHDFAGNAAANFTTCRGCATIGPTPAVLSDAFSGTNIGTYGQYSAGLSAKIADSGWIGFVRADYRNGPDLTGWDGTGGVRYQFTPEATARTAMPVKALIFKAPAAQPVTWGGLYIGAVAGAEVGATHFGYGTGSADPGVAGILGGLDLGYNWQNGAWVYGLEGEWDGTDAKGGVGCGPLSITATFSPLFAINCNAQHSWVASITPRIGYTWDRELFYVKGGVAFTPEQFATTCDFGPVNGLEGVCAAAVPLTISNGFGASDIRAGWTVGYGVQFALTRNWSAKAEADYVDFGNHAIVASDGTPLDVGMHAWQAKIGVNYRFANAQLTDFAGAPLMDSVRPADAAGIPDDQRWARCYVGVSLGGASEQVKYAGVPGAVLVGASPPDAANLAAVTTGNLNTPSAIAGGEGGCNWQAHQFVFGIETDLNGLGKSQASSSASIPTPVFSSFTANSTASSNWLFTLRPRLGFAYNNCLIYATGGLAVGNFNFSQSVLFSDILLFNNFGIPPTTQTGSFNATVLGGVVGGGVEYALSNNWSVKTEYLHVNFDSRSMTENDILFAQFPTVSTAKLSMSIGRAGVNYKW